MKTQEITTEAVKDMLFKHKTGKTVRVFVDDGVAFFCLRDVMRLLDYADTTPHSKLATFRELLDGEKIMIPGENYQNASFLTRDALIECLRKHGSKRAQRLAVLHWLDEEVFPALEETDNSPATPQDDLSPEVIELARAIANLLKSNNASLL